MMQITKQIKADKIKSIILTLSLVLILAFTLAACGGNDKADPGGPSAPQNFTVTAGDGQAVLTWTAPSKKGDSDITKYEVSKDNGSTWVTASSNTGHTFTDLTNGTKYTFKVRAVNAQGNGATTSKAATPKADSTGGTSFEYNWEYVLNHLPAEFSISYSITYSGDGQHETGSFKVLRTSRGYYFEEDGGVEYGTLYIKAGEKYDQYYYDDYEEIFVLNEGYPQTSQDSINTVFLTHCGMFMAPWSDTTGMKKGATQTIAGRSCDTYTFSIGSGGTSLTYTYYIDKAIGCCLKMSYSATAGGSSGGFQFACSEFKTTGITLPAYR